MKKASALRLQISLLDLSITFIQEVKNSSIMASSGTLSPSDSMTLREANGVVPTADERHSIKEEKLEKLEKSGNTTVGVQDSEKENDGTVKADSSNVELAFPDGGWRAWGVVFGASHFLYAEFCY